MHPPKADELDDIHFLIAAQKVFTCTEAARSAPESLDPPAHDAFTRLLRREPPDTDALWGDALDRAGCGEKVSGRATLSAVSNCVSPNSLITEILPPPRVCWRGRGGSGLWSVFHLAQLVWEVSMSFGRILVPLDGSELAERALRYAELIPSPRVRLLTVDPVTLSAARKRWALDQVPPGGGTWRVTSTRAYLTLIGEPLREQGREVEVVVTNGDPAERILAAAADVDMIVMATRGHEATPALFGSVTDHLAGHAPVPMLIVRADTAAITSVAIFRIVVPLDGSPLAEEALPMAMTLGTALEAPLHLIRVVNPATTLTTTTALEREAAAYLARQLRRLGMVTGGAGHEVRTGDADDEILAALRPGDLVVMATRGGGSVRRLLGSVAASLMRRWPAPVALVRAGVGKMVPALAAAKDPDAAAS